MNTNHEAVFAAVRDRVNEARSKVHVLAEDLRTPSVLEQENIAPNDGDRRQQGEPGPCDSQAGGDGRRAIFHGPAEPSEGLTSE